MYFAIVHGAVTLNGSLTGRIMTMVLFLLFALLCRSGNGYEIVVVAVVAVVVVVVVVVVVRVVVTASATFIVGAVPADGVIDLELGLYLISLTWW